VQGQIGLGDDSDHSIVAIHNWNASYLMLLHQPLARLDIVVFAASDRVRCHEFLDRRLFGIQPLCYHGTAQVAISNHAYQFARVLVLYHGQRTNVSVAHRFAYMLGGIRSQAAVWIAAHNVSILHGSSSKLANSESALGLLLIGASPGKLSDQFTSMWITNKIGHSQGT